MSKRRNAPADAARGRIRVINKWRATPRERERAFYVGRPSPLGNPFRASKGSTCARERAAVIEKYEAHLKRKIESGDPEVRAMLNRIYKHALPKGRPEETLLMCFCAPKSCHADVIKKLVSEKLPRPLKKDPPKRDRPAARQRELAL